MEDLAQITINPQGLVVTREELFADLKAVIQESQHLRTHYLRGKASAGNSADREKSPKGYDSSGDYRLHRVLDMAFSYAPRHGIVGGLSWHDWYFQWLDQLKDERDQLLTYAARRSGEPVDRWQNQEEWEAWASGEPPPRKVGLLRGWARSRFEDGMSYEQVLWEVANQVIMFTGEPLDRAKGDNIKKAVDRAYKEVYQRLPPRPIRRWWKPASNAGSLTAGGLKKLGLAWEPRREFPLVLHWDPPPPPGSHPWFSDSPNDEGKQ